MIHKKNVFDFAIEMKKRIFNLNFSVIMWVGGWVVGGCVGGATQTSGYLNLHVAAGCTPLGLQPFDVMAVL